MTKEELALLYREQFGAIYHFILFKVRHKETAEDLTQTVFARALAALPGYRKTAVPPAAWLFTIARNLVRDHFKKRQAFVPGDEEDFFSEVADELARSDSDALARERRACLAVAVSTLSEAEQEFIVLRYLEDKVYAEIAVITGKSEEALRALGYRTRKALKEKLSNYYDDTKE